MLTRLISNFYSILIEVALWITMLFLVFVGAIAGGVYGGSADSGYGLLGMLLGFLLWLVVATVLFGFFILIHDISERIKKIERLKSGS